MPNDMPTYTGDRLREAPFRDPRTGRIDLNIYIPNPELVEAVKLALMLERPLLLMGEPGCGKTLLAKAIAYELHGADYKNRFFRWDIKSTTKAQEGIYHFDAIKRLRMSQDRMGTESFWNEEATILEEIRKRDDSSQDAGKEAVAKPASQRPPEKRLEQLYLQYGLIRKGPLAKAFDACHPDLPPPVLLIDEIDKAEIDFPNDLLLEIEDSEYYISETDSRTQLMEGARPPIVIITSNNEKELPAAFLRRCLFHYIEFPREPVLKQILHRRFERAQHVLGERHEAVVHETVALFTKVRERLKQASEKQNSTSELIDYMQAILHQVESKQYTAQGVESLLKQAQSKQAGGKLAIPFPAVLLKNHETLNLLLAPPQDGAANASTS